MSTNFYAYRRIPVAQRRSEIASVNNKHDELIKLLENEENPVTIYNAIENYVDTIQDLYSKFIPKRIHLGKRSAGWQFYWQVYLDSDNIDKSNYLYYEPSLESIKKFLYDTENWLIADEYGRIYTPDEFFDEIKNVLYKTDDIYDGHSYYQDKTQEHGCMEHYFLSHELKSEDGLRYTFDDFS